MTQPRSQLAPLGENLILHCIQRCVRRAFLCGEDHYTGRSFEHRKTWIEERLRLLAQSFAISVHAYAVMSNHLHLVVELVPDAAAAWRDEEVAERWVRLFPPREDGDLAFSAKCLRLVADPERLRLLRARLADVSWLMRCLAEPIARRANREDGCKGRFWEGRFKSQLLCNEQALLAAMAYVDLNPVRAGIVARVEEAIHTSAVSRIAVARETPQTLALPLGPIMGEPRPPLALSTADYLQLLDWTGRQLAPGKHGRICGDAPAILRGIDADPDRWTTRVRGIGSGYWRVVGAAEDLMAAARRLGQRWMKGIELAGKLG